MTAVTRVPASFRDPAGYLFERDGTLYRTVTERHAADLAHLEESGLYDRLVGERLLVPHERVDPALSPTPAHAVLRPERLRTITHPYEWCPGQLRAAALLTLRLQELALEHGMVLRDASAYNVQFRGVEPVFIDTLSFGVREPDAPWVAYGQFCRHFLAPLTLAAHVDVRLLALLRTNLDGIPLDLAAALAPARTRMRLSLLTHLHLHARSQRSAEAAPEDDDAGRASFSDKAMQGLTDSLRTAVEKLTWDPGGSAWSDYYATAAHYSDAAMEAKERVVDGLLAEIAPSTVWDLGANTGRFSRIAAAHGAEVTAFDVDPAAVEAGWRALREESAPPRVTPAVLDLTNPSPDLGWAHEERASLAARGPVDAVLALALVHHLAIAGNVPLDRLVAYLARLAPELVIEFVPKQDPKVRVLLATREDVFDDYTAEAFEDACRAVGRIVSRTPLPDSDRAVYRVQVAQPA